MLANEIQDLNLGDTQAPAAPQRGMRGSWSGAPGGQPSMRGRRAGLGRDGAPVARSAGPRRARGEARGRRAERQRTVPRPGTARGPRSRVDAARDPELTRPAIQS
jgi:hypothetical protein